MKGLLFLFVWTFAGNAAFAEKSVLKNLFSLPLEQLAKVKISTASKVTEPLKKSAATVNVITAANIQRSGARTIYDVLMQLPGINVGLNQYTDHFISFRGIRSTWSERVLMLLDGHLLNDARSGSATFQFLDSLPVENIARIEVVRGPGSALYGANAFFGVINIITKQPNEIGGSFLSYTGEFESTDIIKRNYNFLLGGKISEDWQGSLNLNLLNGPGPQLNVEADAFGRSGSADQQVQRLDLQAKLNNGPFTIRSRFLQRKAGDGFGALAVLNRQSSQEVEYFFLNVEYQNKLASDMNLNLRLYHDHQKTDNNYTLLPAGSIPPASVFFPWNITGLIGDALAQETIQGSEVRFDYTGFSSQIITIGFAWRREKLHDVQLLSNFDPNPLAVVTNVSAYYNWIDEVSRDVSSIYVQDLWDLQPDLRATIGARYDNYTDFGSTFNPRAGLVWQATQTLSARMSYGKAFRAPSFVQQHIKNNPGQQGNPNLLPETIDTVEMGIKWQKSNTQIDLTLFHSQLRNLIDIPTASIQFQNLGKATVQGFELEGLLHLQSGPKLTANYSYADTEYTVLIPSTQSPKHQVNLIINTTVATNINWNINAHWQSEVERTGIDTRKPIDDVLLINTILTVKRGQWDIKLGVYNLTNENHATAAPLNSIPGDFTANGRSIIVGAKYEL